jgi:hypothetical protein
MRRISFGVDETTHARIRSAAEAAGMSLSRWVATAVTEKAANQWPVEVSALAGAWSDFPSIEKNREGTGRDLPQECG